MGFLALIMGGLYLWIAAQDGRFSTELWHLATGAGITATLLCAITARVFTDSKVRLWWALATYLLLLLSLGLFFNLTGQLASPYLFMWPLVAVSAGIFGAPGLIPVIGLGVGYLMTLLAGNAISQPHLIPTILLIITPMALSLIVWSQTRKPNEEYQRDPVAYKQPSAGLVSLIQESEHILSAIGDGVIAVDSKGVVQLINHAAQTLLGWSRHDAVSLQYQSVLKLTDEQNKTLDKGADPVLQALNTNQEIRSKDLKAETKSGKKRHISLVASPLDVDAGGGVIVMIRDITKERAEEHQQTEFISTASHEMRTPVASIEGYLGLALNPSTATIDDKARDFITKAHESAQHLGRLFQDLLDVTKADDGRLVSNPVVLDIVDYVGGVVDSLRHKADEKGINLTYKPDPARGEKGDRNLSPVYYINLDKDHIRELVSNLTENAIKYTPAGEVSIDITGDNEHITISIKDSGIGIPAEDLPHLFQKFYRVDNSDTREIGGTGLGLYLCRRLAEAMGGRVWAESVYKQGSTFYVELPRLATNDARRMLAEQEAEAAKKAANPVPAPTPTDTSSILSPIAPPPASPTTTPAPVSTVAPAPVLMTPPAPATPILPTPSAPPSAASPSPQSMPVAATGTPTPPPATPQRAPLRLNISLNHIENNPGAFVQSRGDSVTVPERPTHNRGD